MKLLWSLLALFATLGACQDADQQDQLARALELLQQMPECARTCLLEAVAAAGVTAGNIDLASSCSNTAATESIELCATSTCTIREQLTSKNITETLCNRPVREASPISIASIIGGSFAIVAYLLRVASKIYFPCQTGARIDNDLWWDDITITFAMALIIPITVLSNVLTGLGIGKDVWTVPFDNLTEALKVYFYDELLYLLALPTIKIAILCTYLRIFPTKQFRTLVFVAIGLNVAYAITFFLITVFQCDPVPLAWTHWDQEQPGRCNNINAQSWASAALNIILDLIVVILPMPMLWKMNLNPRKKFLVMLMFGVGLFVTFVSILRLRLLVKFGDSKNLTYDYKQVGYWTVIEVDTALVCACMPGIRNLIRRAFPKLMGQSVGASSGLAASGLSGRTAVGSGIDKDGTEVFVRPRHSDDDHFIPLENISTQRVNETDSAQVHTNPLNHGRNFSRPLSPPESAWRDWNGDTKQRPLSPT
ncbi:Putative extracellular membrane protein, CFEM [Septoria linicola]|uniref:Extracellular membrane protein, CFEM n=1 Tax=Septoria linicola TaxID=215465 RepID=A0A9Q9B192_9PEZI|nr:putative extracellular membrane protein, CFEM [Septoria linicola]USW59079.1 Putative extracellular membrane protein, CFEM [Septoria linicola]